MDCALAKELYDAGFPKSPTFKCCTDTPHIVCSETDGIARDSCHMKVDNSPTLSELIEACGEDFGALEVMRYTNQSPIWVAGAFINRDGEIEGGQQGTTPEEAVARLWLALKK